MTSRPSLTVSYDVQTDYRALVCTLTGSLIGTAESYAFLQEVQEQLENGCLHVILDLAHVKRINSTGVGILAAIYTSAHKREGQVVLVNIDNPTRSLLSVMHLLDFLKTAGSLGAALGLVQEPED
jgi:anti-sigma B factor antagonist